MNWNSHITQPNPDYGSCERTYAELRIYPAVSTVKDITIKMGIEPTTAQDRGDWVSSKQGHLREVPRTGWFLSSEKMVFSLDLRDHLDWVLEKISNSKDALKKLRKENGLKMAIYCIWWSKTGQGGPAIWPEQMELMAEYGLECCFDCCFFGDDDEE